MIHFLQKIAGIFQRKTSLGKNKKKKKSNKRLWGIFFIGLFGMGIFFGSTSFFIENAFGANNTQWLLDYDTGSGSSSFSSGSGSGSGNKGSQEGGGLGDILNALGGGGGSAASQADSNLKQEKDFKQLFGEIASLLVSLFTPLIAIMAAFVGDLMSNDFVLGANLSVNDTETAMDIGGVLHGVWLIFRDIMNYIFILILIIIALMNVVGPLRGGDNMSIKSTLPKLVFAIIVVNFTWFGAKVVLDAASVATHVVYSIPQTFTGSTVANLGKCTVSNGYIDGACTPVKVILHPERVINGTGAPSTSGPNTTDAGVATIQWEDFDYSKFGSNTIANIYAFSILQIQNLPRVTGGTDINWSSITINSLSALIIMIVLLVVFFAMMVAMMVRVMVLWVNIVLSPLMGLFLFKDDLGIGGSSQIPEDIIGLGAFVKNAFLPAMMGVPMVVGFILISYARSVQYNTGLSSSSLIEFSNGFINGMSNIHQIFWYVLAIGILWASVNIAKESNAITSAIVEPVAQKVVDAGKWLATSPMYINFIPIAKRDASGNPTGETGLLDVEDIGRLWQGTSQLFEQKEAHEIEDQAGINLSGNVSSTVDMSPTTKSQLDTIGKEQASNYLNTIKNTSGTTGTGIQGVVQQLRNDQKTVLADELAKNPNGFINTLNSKVDSSERMSQERINISIRNYNNLPR